MRVGVRGSPALGRCVTSANSAGASASTSRVNRMSRTRSVAGSYHTRMSTPPGDSTTAAIHSSDMRSRITSRRFAVALLVLLSTATRTRLVAADLLGGDDRPLALARTRARQRRIERLDDDLGRLDDRAG